MSIRLNNRVIETLEFVLIVTLAPILSGCTSRWKVHRFYTGPEQPLEDVAVIILLDDFYDPYFMGPHIPSIKIDKGPYYNCLEAHLLPGIHTITCTLYGFESLGGSTYKITSGEPIITKHNFKRGQAYGISSSLNEDDEKWTLSINYLGSNVQVAQRMAMHSREGFFMSEVSPGHWRELLKRQKRENGIPDYPEPPVDFNMEEFKQYLLEELKPHFEKNNIENKTKARILLDIAKTLVEIEQTEARIMDALSQSIEGMSILSDMDVKKRIVKILMGITMIINDSSQSRKGVYGNNKHIELNVSEAASYVKRGNIYYRSKQHNEAISEYSKAIELDPHYASAYYNRGNAYASLRRFEEAKRDLLKAVELNPALKPNVKKSSDTYQLNLKFD